MGQGGQGGAHVLGEDIVLAAVGFVGDHDDVAPIRKLRVAPAGVGQEFLHGGKDHTARPHPQCVPQVVAAGGLLRRLAQHVGAAGKCAVQLVVKVVTVG